jgi:hypothetical protein
MSLIIGERIRVQEFGGAIPDADMEVLLRSARVSLSRPIKGESLPKGTRLLKAYATSVNGPRRIVYLLEVAAGDLLLLFYRDKNDAVGANITLKNAAFKKQLHRNLDALAEDLKAGSYQVIETVG